MYLYFLYICVCVCVFRVLISTQEQILQLNIGDSSPSHFTSMKGSSACLHWNYTYIGDGAKGKYLKDTCYKEQIIGFSNGSQIAVKRLAKQIGQTGALTLESPVPAPFNGRVEVIASNSTLVIHNLQYNDSTYQFSSSTGVKVDMGAGPTLNIFKSPTTNITVNGVPEFIKQPSSKMDVNEGSNLQLRIEMDGNPQPSADFRWLHLTGSSPTNVPSAQLYPFVYSSTYTLNNIDGSYCGRILQTTVKNSIGSSSVRNTNVTVLLNLEAPFLLNAILFAASRYVKVQWKKVNSGACFVKYQVVLINSSGAIVYNESSYNLGELKIYNLPSKAKVTDVQLTVTFNNSSKTVTARVSEIQVATQTTAANELMIPSTKEDPCTSASSIMPTSHVTAVSSSKIKTPSSDSRLSTLIIALASCGACVLGITLIVAVCCYTRWLKETERFSLCVSSGLSGIQLHYKDGRNSRCTIAKAETQDRHLVSYV